MSPKVLVISNTPLNMGNSNGRTLGLLLSGIKKENLMQFCIKDEAVSEELVREAYCVSDSMILKHLFKIKIAAKKLPFFVKGETATIDQIQGAKKTGLKFLVREIVWRIKLRSVDFLKRAKQFKPDVILFQMGSSGFLADLAYDLSKVCSAKVIVFTTEDYYFKKWNFLQPNKKSIAFTAYMAKYRKSIERLMEITTVCVANTDSLAERFNKRFCVKTEVIMAAASDSISDRFSQQQNKVVYAGNLTLNRYKSIIAVAEAVKKIDQNTVVEIYGKTTPEIEIELKSHDNIVIKGFIKYDLLLPILANARLLLHCESFDDFYKLDLQAAFSTKIADSLASGVPLLLFAPDFFAETTYLQKCQCAFVCTDNEQLNNCIKTALQDEKKRAAVLDNAKSIVAHNHNLENNQKKMFEIIVSGC